MATDYQGSDQTFVILSQIFGAFAHGAGGMIVHGEVILQARADYQPVITQHADKWSRVQLRVLEAARSMGRLAAHKALSRGQAQIAIEDYAGARREVAGLAICPFFHPHPED